MFSSKRKKGGKNSWHARRKKEENFCKIYYTEWFLRNIVAQWSSCALFKKRFEVPTQYSRAAYDISTFKWTGIRK